MRCLMFVVLAIVALIGCGDEGILSPEDPQTAESPAAPRFEFANACPSYLYQNTTHSEFVPGGTFIMGGNLYHPHWASPKVSVTVGHLWADKYPVTYAEYHHFLSVSGYMPQYDYSYEKYEDMLIITGYRGVSTLRERVTDWNLGARAIKVSFTDAQAYAAWVGKRLPTEAEWEYLARGGTSTRFPWGNDVSHAKNQYVTKRDRTYMAAEGAFVYETFRVPNGRGFHNPNSYPYGGKVEQYVQPYRVGHYPPNGYGLHDFIGDWQWCSDKYNPNAYLLLSNGITPEWIPQIIFAGIVLSTGHEPVEDFRIQIDTDKLRVVRGGGEFHSQITIDVLEDRGDDIPAPLKLLYMKYTAHVAERYAITENGIAHFRLVMDFEP